MHYDQKKADKVLTFVKTLRHTKGKWAGVPFTLLPWQEQAIKDIFGTVGDNGLRQYNMAYIEATKKQGKSELCAALALYGLCADEEWAAEIYGAAADRSQASIIFDVAVAMVDQHEQLRKHIKPVLSQKRLVYMPTKSFYQVLSAEAYTKHGLNIAMAVIDELHAQPSADLYNVLTEGAGDAREQPLTIAVSTAGNDPDRSSIGWTVHKTAVDVLTGNKDDPKFYAMLYGLDREERRIWKGREYETIESEIENDEEWRKVWQNEEIWQKVNPSIGHTVAWDKVRDQFTRASGNLAREKNFRWLRLNSWEKLKTNKWLGLDFWDLCRNKIHKDRLKGRRCYVGMDLSSKIDLTAVVQLFPPDDINTKWLVVPHFWLPEDNLAERVQMDKVKYDEWAANGYLHLTPGNVIDYDFIEQQIYDLLNDYNVVQIGYDPWNAMQTAIHLQDQGANMLEVRQGYRSMSPAMKEIEQLVRGQKLIHDGHPVLRWNVSNVEVKMDENENIRPVKGKGIERIDGLVAMINAMFCAMREEEDIEPYADGREVFVV